MLIRHIETADAWCWRELREEGPFILLSDYEPRRRGGYKQLSIPRWRRHSMSTTARTTSHGQARSTNQALHCAFAVHILGTRKHATGSQCRIRYCVEASVIRTSSMQHPRRPLLWQHAGRRPQDHAARTMQRNRRRTLLLLLLAAVSSIGSILGATTPAKAQVQTVEDKAQSANALEQLSATYGHSAAYLRM